MLPLTSLPSSFVSFFVQTFVKHFFHAGISNFLSPLPRQQTEKVGWESSCEKGIGDEYKKLRETFDVTRYVYRVGKSFQHSFHSPLFLFFFSKKERWAHPYSILLHPISSFHFLFSSFVSSWWSYRSWKLKSTPWFVKGGCHANLHLDWGREWEKWNVVKRRMDPRIDIIRWNWSRWTCQLNCECNPFFNC